jgi:hypothetical protein
MHGSKQASLFDHLVGEREQRRRDVEDYRLVARVQYQAGVLVIQFFGTHAEYDEIDAETV